MVSKIATEVSAFFEKSPRKTEKSDDTSAVVSSDDFLKLPESVEGVKVKSGRGGRVFVRLSGRISLVSDRLKVLLANSVSLISVEKL